MITDREKAGLIGPVRTVRTETIDVSRHLGPPSALPVETVSYDIGGRCVESVTVNPDGSMARRAWSWQDGLTLTESSFLDASGKLLNAGRCTCDERGRMVEGAWSGPDGSWTAARVPVWTKEGEKIEELAPAPESGVFAYEIEGTHMGVSAPGAVRKKTVYGTAGKPREVLFHDRGGATVIKVVLRYDAAKRLIRVVHYASTGGWRECGTDPNWTPSRVDRLLAPLARRITPLVIHVSLRFQALHGHARRRRLRDAIRSLGCLVPHWETVYAYNAAGREIETFTYFLGHPTERTTVTYDERGLRAEVAHYVSGSLQQRCRYAREFDAHGNWTKETMSVAIGRFALFEPRSVIERRITYDSSS